MPSVLPNLLPSFSLELRVATLFSDAQSLPQNSLETLKRISQIILNQSFLKITEQVFIGINFGPNHGFNHGHSCHASTLSQAWDNRHVNPSGVNNTFLELAQGFQTPVHTYNSPITGEYITKFGNRNTIRCVYIYIYQRFKRLQTYNPTDPFYTKESLIQHVYTRRFIYTIYLKGKIHTKLQRKYNSCPAHGE